MLKKQLEKSKNYHIKIQLGTVSYQKMVKCVMITVLHIRKLLSSVVLYFMYIF